MAKKSAATKTGSSTAAAKPAPAPRPASSSISSSPPAPVPKPQTSSALSPRSSPKEIALYVWSKYLQDTPARTKLLDVFMAFLVVVGAIQFLYCILAGNYPFNAFLSGFSAAVGQFVLTASLRMQTSETPPVGASNSGKKSTTKSIDGLTGDVTEQGINTKISSERAFADFVFGSLILHGFCINFIN